MGGKTGVLLAGGAAAVVCVALWVGLGGGGSAPAPSGTGAVRPSAAPPSAAPSTGASAKAAAGPTGTLAGRVRFAGTPPVRTAPAGRAAAAFCSDKEVPDAPAFVEGGMLRDALVRLGEVEGTFEPPRTPAVIDQVDCMYVPRVLGVIEGQGVEIRNSDGTLHNVHAYRGAGTVFNQAQPRGAAPIDKTLDEVGVYRFACDVHPWMRAYVVITPHPFFAVSGADGSFRIPAVPAGKHEVQAWHPALGARTATVQIEADAEASLDFTFEAGSLVQEPAPLPSGG